MRVSLRHWLNYLIKQLWSAASRRTHSAERERQHLQAILDSVAAAWPLSQT
jgi:hypothetical protein